MTETYTNSSSSVRSSDVDPLEDMFIMDELPELARRLLKESNIAFTADSFKKVLARSGMRELVIAVDNIQRTDVIDFFESQQLPTPPIDTISLMIEKFTELVTADRSATVSKLGDMLRAKK